VVTLNNIIEYFLLKKHASKGNCKIFGSGIAIALNDRRKGLNKGQKFNAGKLALKVNQALNWTVQCYTDCKPGHDHYQY